MVPAAAKALEEADVIAGYRTYLDLIPAFIRDKEVISTSMKKEIDRCRAAIARALEGNRVALVSSGDAGIYGMAGLVLELCLREGIPLNPPLAEEGIGFRVVPGVPALCAAASLLGAPLMHDFASISLSDLLTPWDLIEERIKAAAGADFVICIYNPRSRKREWQLGRACELIMDSRPGTTPAAVVRKAMRTGEGITITTLKDLPAQEVDMQSICVVGNTRTFSKEGFMVTPRGYGDKYSL